MLIVTKTPEHSRRVSPEDRERIIADAAYYCAEQRGFDDCKENRHRKS
jgi:hypothetical protein